MPRKKKVMPKGKQQGKALGPLKKEVIRQTFLLTGNKRETARQCSVSEKSVYNVLNQVEEAEAAKNRVAVANQLAGKIHTKADQIIDSISVEDLKSGYLTQTDEDGKEDYKFDRQGRPIYIGPTLNQKVLSVAILADKLKVMDDYRQQVDEAHGMGALPTPETIGHLVTGIKGKLKSLRILDVQFEDENAELKQKADALLAQAQQDIEVDQKIEDAKYEVLDFDNPGGSDGIHEGGNSDGMPDEKDTSVPHQEGGGE